MPSKRDVRSNVVDPQYAYLGLHQAALSGNVGLVQYALSEGQPVDAVWDGISALHAAAAGGSEHVARLLIDSGADVNFGRQPRNERELKTRTASSSSTTPPIDKFPDALGPPHAADALLNPGSTPLHFACAHNNVAVARLLLASGAAPHIPDKRGVTPLELLPPASNPSATSSTANPPQSDLLRAVIREYYENEKAKEKEFQKSQIRFYGKAAAVLGFPRNEDDNKRLPGRPSVEHVSRSPKQGPAQLASPKHVPQPISTPPVPPPRRSLNSTSTPPPSPRHFSTPTSDRERVLSSPPPFPGYTFGSASTSPALSGSVPPPLIPSEQRRPSLPHIFESPPSSSRTTQLPASPSPCQSRPRSADGTNPPAFTNNVASQNVATNAVLSTLTHAHPRTKRSLLSLFKKSESASDEIREKEAERELARRKALSSTSFSSLSPSKALTHREEVRTAPAERTTFALNARDRPRISENVFCDDDYEDYGVPIRRMEPGPPFLSLHDEQEQSCEDSEGDEAEDDCGDGDGEATEADTGERTSTETGRTVSIPIPSMHVEPGVVGLGLTPVSLSPSPPPAPPLPPPSGARLSPRTRPGILRGDFSVHRSGSRGALRFESRLRERGSSGSLVEKVERGSPSLRKQVSSSLRENTSPSVRHTNNESLREKTSRSSLRVNPGVDHRPRDDSLSSALSYASHDTSTGTMTSIYTAASVPSLDRDSTRGTFSSDEDDEDEDMEVPALGLNIRTVSNHAQAEALVQKAAKEILELNEVTEGSSLTAQLAAYGETLQLERRFARGEAQRFKSPTQLKVEADSVVVDVDEGSVEKQREEEKRRRAQERMVWSQRTMERYARGGSKERRSSDTVKGGAPGCPLERSTSLEKEIGTGEVKRPKKPRSPKIRRPHTSDSVASTASGTTAPRFGHGSTSSSGSVSRVAGGTQQLRVFRIEQQGRRAQHHPSQSTSSAAIPVPRSESLDGGTGSIPSPEVGNVEDVPVPPNINNINNTNAASSRCQSSHSSSPSAGSSSPSAGASPFMIASGTVDEFGTTGRPLKQRFGGGLRSLFGKSR